MQGRLRADILVRYFVDIGTVIEKELNEGYVVADAGPPDWCVTIGTGVVDVCAAFDEGAGDRDVVGADGFEDDLIYGKFGSV